MYFCKIENFAYGEINERSFSDPTAGVSKTTHDRDPHWRNVLISLSNKNE